MLVFPNFCTPAWVCTTGGSASAERMLGWGCRVDLLPKPTEMEGAPDELEQERRSQVGFYRGEGFSNEGVG